MSETSTDTGFIDLHCHVLPDVDDGPASMEESLAMLRAAAAEGIRVIVAAPHRLDGVYDVPRDVVRAKLAALRHAAETEGIDVRVLEGADVHLHEEIVERVRFDHSLTVGGGGRYVLLELPRDTVPYEAPEAVFRLLVFGIVPIISHPERNTQVQQHPDRLYGLVRQGALVQVTASSVTGGHGRAAQRCAHRLFLDESVHFLATDAHDVSRRPPAFSEALRLVEDWIGPERARRLVTTNPQAVLDGERVEPGVPRPLRAHPRRAGGGPERIGSRLLRASRTLVMLILLASVALFGAVHAEVQLPLVAAGALAGALWWAGCTLRRRPLFAHKGLSVPILIFLAFLALTMVPLPAAWLRAAGIETDAATTTISSSPYLTARTLAVCLVAAIVFWISATTPRRRRHVLAMTTVLVLIASASALYGIIEQMSGHQHLLWRARVFYLESVSGTFVNRNHFATLTALVLPLALGCALHWHTRGRPGETFRERVLAHDPEARMSKTVLFAFAAVVLATAMVLSLSRGGLVAALAGVGGMMLMMLLRARLRRAALVAIVVAAVAVAPAMWLAWPPMQERLDAAMKNDLSTNFRIETWQDTLGMIAARPIAGWGAGSFDDAFRAHKRGDYARLEVRHAHNDYLEWTAETGLVGAALIAWIAIALVVTLLRGFRRAKSSADAALLAGLTGSVLAGMSAALFDYSLRIPAVLWAVAAVAGTVAAASRLAHTRAPSQTRVSAQTAQTARTARAA